MPHKNPNGTVAPSVVLPDADLLKDPRLTAVASAIAAHVAAVDAHLEALAAVEEVEDLAEEDAVAQREAGLKGTKAPTTLSPAYLDGRREAARRDAAKAERDAYRTAVGVEVAVADARKASRALRLAMLKDTDAETRADYATFCETLARRDKIAAAIRATDLRAAQISAKNSADPEAAERLAAAVDAYYRREVDGPASARKTSEKRAAWDLVAEAVDGLDLAAFEADPFESTAFRTAREALRQRTGRAT